MMRDVTTSIQSTESENVRNMQIDPNWTENEVCQAVYDAPHRHETVPKAQFGRSQTLDSVRHGRVANRRHDPEESVVGKMRSARKIGTKDSN